MVLAAIGEAARPAMPELLNMRFDESGKVRLMVARALVNLGEPLSNILPGPEEGVRDSDMCDAERVDLLDALFCEYG